MLHLIALYVLRLFYFCKIVIEFVLLTTRTLTKTLSPGEHFGVPIDYYGLSSRAAHASIALSPSAASFQWVEWTPEQAIFRSQSLSISTGFISNLKGVPTAMKYAAANCSLQICLFCVICL
jgi:hypothetical protein